jgi:hypothetical protein
MKLFIRLLMMVGLLSSQVFAANLPSLVCFNSTKQKTFIFYGQIPTAQEPNPEINYSKRTGKGFAFVSEDGLAVKKIRLNTLQTLNGLDLIFNLKTSTVELMYHPDLEEYEGRYVAASDLFGLTCAINQGVIFPAVSGGN